MKICDREAGTLSVSVLELSKSRVLRFSAAFRMPDLLRDVKSVSSVRRSPNEFLLSFPSVVVLAAPMPMSKVSTSSSTEFWRVASDVSTSPLMGCMSFTETQNFQEKFRKSLLPKLPQETTSGSKCFPEKIPSLLSQLLALLDDGLGLGSRGLCFLSRTDRVSDNKSKLDADGCCAMSFNAVQNSLVRVFLLLSAALAA